MLQHLPLDRPQQCIQGPGPEGAPPAQHHHLQSYVHFDGFKMLWVALF